MIYDFSFSEDEPLGVQIVLKFDQNPITYDVMQDIIRALEIASARIYSHVKRGHGLKYTNAENTSGDVQIELDILADDAFREELRKIEAVSYVVSEEQPDLTKYMDGKYSVALDPLDGSKSALVGIPSGAIFGIFENIESASDFCGTNIRAGGFFVFGAALEVFYAVEGQCFRGMFNEGKGTWEYAKINSEFPSSNFFAINASNFKYWDKWLQNYYKLQIMPVDEREKPQNLRWYASMVSEVKRLILQGGVFGYPSDSRPGYENGHLRLVYEALPMAYLVQSLGGASSNGEKSILEVIPTALHQKTSVFLGEPEKIARLIESKNKI